MAESNSPKAKVRFIKSESQRKPIEKALTSVNMEDTVEAQVAGLDGALSRPYPIMELQNVVEMSTILKQCIDAYKRNITGFGAVPEYIEDDTAQEETPEMKKEWDMLKFFTRFFSFNMSFEDLMGEIIEDREITGNGYLEIVRDGKGMPVSGNRLDPKYMYVAKRGPFIPVTWVVDGQEIQTQQRFRKYIQNVGLERVFFKEIGDPRKMDYRNGEYVDNLPEEFEANEIAHFKIGSGPYGVPRWIGQLVHMYGARKAEELNYNYFTQGRHTPMAILLHNAILSPESEEALQDYAASVQGTDNAHKFLLIEAEGLTEGTMQDEMKNAKVELKSLADMLQQDALFLEYDDASREKVQSAFRLPDIYVGRSKDFNRATADTARTITEEQVFEPERKSIEWMWNSKILLPYMLKFTQLSFKKPEISNADEIVSIITAANLVGALAPNDIRDIVGKMIGKPLEPLEGDQFDVPKGAMQAQAQVEGMQINNESLKSGVQQTPKKGQPSAQGTQDPGKGTKAKTPGADKGKTVTGNKGDTVQKAYEQDSYIVELKNMRDMLVKQYAGIIGNAEND